MLEAAKIDGANSWQTLWKVTIPNVMPSITICTFLTLTNGFKLFDQNLALTGGQPYIISPDGTSSYATEMLALNILHHLQHRQYNCQRRGTGQGSHVLHPGGGASASDPAQRDPEEGGPAVMKNSGISKEKHRSQRALTIVFAVLCRHLLSSCPIIDGADQLVQDQQPFVNTRHVCAVPTRETFAGTAATMSRA